MVDDISLRKCHFHSWYVKKIELIEFIALTVLDEMCALYGFLKILYTPTKQHL